MTWLRCASTIAALLTATVSVAAAEAWAADSSDAMVAATVDAITLDEVVVFGRRLNLVGEKISASEGSIGQDEIANRPLLRLRHFGRYPLREDGRIETAGSTLLNLRVGREWKHWSLYLDVLNALDSQDHDIDYYFPSRSRDEPPGGVDDVHFHVFEPRALRLSLRHAF